MSRDVRIIRPAAAAPWLDPVLRDISGGFRTKQDEDADLNAVAALETTGLLARTADGAAATRALVAPPAGITVANGDGVAGDPTLGLTDDLAALEGLAGTGLIARTADGAAATRTLVAPPAGIAIANGNGVAGNPTLALANDLAAYEGLGANGLVARTGDGAAAVRTIAGTAAEIAVTNGDGVAGNPTLSLPAALNFTGKTVTGGVYATIGSLSIDDAAFLLDIVSTVPTIQFDAGDALTFNRAANSYAFAVGAATLFAIGASGVRAIVTSSDGTGLTWGAGQLVVAASTSDTAKGLGLSVDTANNDCTISALQPAAAWLDLQYRAADHRFYTAGATLRLTLHATGASIAGNADVDGVYSVDGTQVLTNRRTGWATPTGTATRTAFATGSVSVAQLAERVKALIDDLRTHGLIGP